MPKTTSKSKPRDLAGCIQCYLLKKKIQDMETHLERLKKPLMVSQACQTEPMEPMEMGRENVDTTTYRIHYWEHEGDVFFEMDNTCRDLLGITDHVSLEQLQETCQSLPFAYTEKDLEEQAHWYFLLFFFKQRAPFSHRVVLHHEYSVGEKSQRQWRRERVFFFEFIAK